MRDEREWDMSGFDAVCVDECAVVIKLDESRWDASNDVEIHSSANDLLDEHPLLVVDLSNVVAMDNHGLRGLVGIAEKATPRGSIRLVGTQPEVRKLIDRGNLGDRLPSFDSVGEALRAA